MPEFRSPGVYLEEFSGQPKSIQGLSTSTAGFVGPTHTGPLALPPYALTSLAEFERTYGDGQPLQFDGAPLTPNFMWHAARAFFENGGARLYVARVFSPRSLGGAPNQGNDGRRPTAADFAGAIDPATSQPTGLNAFESVDEISVVAAPGVTFGYKDNSADANATLGLLISHAAQMRYRIALLDSGDGQSVDDLRSLRATLDSSYAALYYPWVTILNPVMGAPVNLPPSGFIAGIYARNDAARGVSKSPANLAVNLAIGLETTLDRAQQNGLSPLGINSIRFFAGRGYRVWGARTTSSDPEWKYVGLRRYFAYLEHSIDQGTQWAVFEPNGEPLWARVRQTISNFLFDEWRNGALQGTKPDDAYFVRCDRTTMTQEDIDNGRLVVLVGVAPLRPAEFVIFRIGQWTADRS